MSLPYYVDAVRRVFGEEDVAEASLRCGQFHDVLLTPTKVYRFPRNRSAASRMAVRAEVLRVLSTLDLGVSTPQVLSVEDGALPCLVISRVPGRPLERAELASPRAVERVAGQIAVLLGELERAGQDERVRDLVGLSSSDRWADFAEGVRRELFPLMSPAGRQRAEAELVAVTGLDPVTSALVHGDLGGENVLWELGTGGPRLVGVVDWDEVSVGDPAEDLAAIAASYGENLVRRVLQLRGMTGLSEHLDRIRTVQATFALQQALSGMLDADEAEVADGLGSYR
ncbi:aminoglycoside phosphotransferase family protein [Streptoalloteichus hindustanus]|uniref:Phosphotransferase enzyme family protein n=1 Tax=Streptoalloteichus hindustanus TaxID=2017 RepID=A0A1M5FBZ9_STRHI|nr:aminoglycoside phosphotransferase family protein [Streptoalloteichus hindustanus]SHF88622.1 Phosphotransferase enzyme family protein [Streptoalloteichus hindustanus]